MAVTASQKRAAIELAVISYIDEASTTNQAADMQKALSTTIPAAANGPWTLVWGPAEVEGILAYVAVGNDNTQYAVVFRGSLSDIHAKEFIDNWVLDVDVLRQVPWLYPTGNQVQ